MELRQQKAVKGRNISVSDVVSHMSDGVFIRKIFLVSGTLQFAWTLVFCLTWLVWLHA